MPGDTDMPPTAKQDNCSWRGEEVFMVLHCWFRIASLTSPSPSSHRVQVQTQIPVLHLGNLLDFLVQS